MYNLCDDGIGGFSVSIRNSHAIPDPSSSPHTPPLPQTHAYIHISVVKSLISYLPEKHFDSYSSDRILSKFQQFQMLVLLLHFIIKVRCLK